MGYQSRVTGRIEIDPPLPWSAVEDSAYLPPKSFEVAYEITETRTSMPTGWVIEAKATAIVPTIEDPYNAYDLERELGQIVAEAAAAGARMTGAIIRSGEEQGDLERFVVDNTLGWIRSEQAVLRWPDGTPVDLS